MTKDERRKAMPLSTAFLDDMREHFGVPTYIRATENGHTVEWGTTEPGVGIPASALVVESA